MTKQKAIILMGPTASGKTGIAVQLARKINGEIISADSRQVFKQMDIGTGKDLDEYKEVPYHLIDVVEAGAEFSVSDFQSLAWQALNLISQKKHIPIICGGTGHYIKALLDDYQFDHKKSDLELTGRMEDLSTEELHQQLKLLDMWNDNDWESCSKRRMARAIEKKLEKPTSQSNYPCFTSVFYHRAYFIDINRQCLRNRIKNRLMQRLEEGMVEEVENLLKIGVTHQRLERYGLEYKYLSLLIKGDISKDKLIEKLCVEIGRYAKRQMTFIRYMQRNGHQLIPIKNFEALWNDAARWIS